MKMHGTTVKKTYIILFIDFGYMFRIEQSIIRPLTREKIAGIM